SWSSSLFWGACPYPNDRDILITLSYGAHKHPDRGDEHFMGVLHVPTLRAESQQACQCLEEAAEIRRPELEELRLHLAAQLNQLRNASMACSRDREVPRRVLCRRSPTHSWAHEQAGHDHVQQRSGLTVRGPRSGPATCAASRREPEQGRTAAGFQQTEPPPDGS